MRSINCFMGRVMPKYKLTIEYNGGPYVGWQRQKNGHSVQEALESAIYEFTGQTVTIGGGSRTDAGVHAFGQVAHVDLEKDWSDTTVEKAINAKLAIRDEQVMLLSAEKVASDWDSRFLAKRRYYLYRIINRPQPLTIDRGLAWCYKFALDPKLMDDAAKVLVGRHDFTTFRNIKCQANSPVKTLDSLTVKTSENDNIMIETSSRSFLHSQVRSMVGSLCLVGEKKWSKDDLKSALEACDRSKCGPVAPSCGLYLVKVEY